MAPLAIACSLSLSVPSLADPGSAFVYQGRITNNGTPVSGTADLRFTLYDQPTGGSVIGGPITASSLSVAEGLFTTELDFSIIPTGDPLFLGIEVAFPSGSSFVGLSARRELLPSVYSMYSEWAGTALDDDDRESDNEHNETLVLNGTTLELTDAGGTLSVDFATLDPSAVTKFTIDPSSTFVITQPGHYVLTQSVTMLPGNNAIWVQSPHAIVDLNGHTIDGAGAFGILVYDSAEVRNGSISGFTVGVHDATRIQQLRISNCTVAIDTEQCVVTNVYITDCASGILVEGGIVRDSVIENLAPEPGTTELYGIYSNGPAVISGNIVAGVSGAGAALGVRVSAIYTEGSGPTVIESNSIMSIGGLDSYNVNGICVRDPAVIRNNTLHDLSAQDGVLTAIGGLRNYPASPGFDPAPDCQVVGNSISKLGGLNEIYGIGGIGQGSLVSGNAIEGAFSSTAAIFGVETDENVTVSDNVLAGFETDGACTGIYAQPNCAIGGNRIHDLSSGLTAAGIRTRGNAHIHDNSMISIEGNLSCVGISGEVTSNHFVERESCHVEDNLLQGLEVSGVHPSGQTAGVLVSIPASIEGNTISGLVSKSRTRGVFALGHPATVNGNTIYEFRTLGGGNEEITAISISGALGSEASNNSIRSLGEASVNTAVVGIKVVDSNGTIVSRNQISDLQSPENTYGISVEDTERAMIDENRITRVHFGHYIHASCNFTAIRNNLYGAGIFDTSPNTVDAGGNVIY